MNLLFFVYIKLSLIIRLLFSTSNTLIYRRFCLAHGPCRSERLRRRRQLGAGQRLNPERHHVACCRQRTDSWQRR